MSSHDPTRDTGMRGWKRAAVAAVGACLLIPASVATSSRPHDIVRDATPRGTAPASAPTA